MKEIAAATSIPYIQLFYDAFKASPIGIAVENLDGQPLFVNPALCSMLGFSEEEMRGKHCVEFSPPEDAEKDWALFQQLRAGSIDHYYIEKRFLRRDGSLIWGRLSISLLNSRPSPLVVASVEDITEKKRAQDDLELVTREMAAAVTRCSRDLRYLWANQGYAEWLQRPLNEIVGRPIVEVLGNDAFKAFLPHFNRVLTGEKVHYEQETNFRGIGQRWVSATYSPTLDADGHTNGWVEVVLDITERKRAEEALRVSEERLHLAIESGSVGGWDYNLKTGKKVWFGETHAQLGMAPDEAPGSFEESWGRIHRDDCEHLQHALRVARDKHEQFNVEFRVVWRDGTTRWVRSRGRFFYATNGDPERLLGLSIDITENKQAERALREMNRVLDEQSAALRSQEELLRVFVKNVPAAVAMLDRDMRYLQVSERWCTDYLPGRAEILGRSHYEIFPDMPERWKEVHRRALQGETLRADEDRWDGQDGSHWARWEVRPWKTAEGVVGGILILAEDITRRKQMEEVLSDLSRKLIESQEQERARIGRELHDDINQRLAMLALEIEQLQDNPSEIQPRVHELRKQMIEISNDVQALSHDLHSSKLEYMGVVAGMKSWCKEFAARQKMEIDFRSDVRCALSLEVGRSLFRVLQEALNNAMKHSGVRRVQVQLREDSTEIHLVISDLGRGFHVEAALQGRGLGLTSMKERIRLVNGKIAIDSKPMGGTTIRVRVPLRSEQEQRATG